MEIIFTIFPVYFGCMVRRSFIRSGACCFRNCVKFRFNSIFVVLLLIFNYMQLNQSSNQQKPNWRKTMQQQQCNLRIFISPKPPRRNKPTNNDAFAFSKSQCWMLIIKIWPTTSLSSAQTSFIRVRPHHWRKLRRALCPATMIWKLAHWVKGGERRPTPTAEENSSDIRHRSGSSAAAGVIPQYRWVIIFSCVALLKCMQLAPLQAI